MFAFTNSAKYRIQLAVQVTGVVIGSVWVFISLAILLGSSTDDLKAMAILTLLMGLFVAYYFARNGLNFSKVVKGRIKANNNGIEIEAEITSIKPKLIGRPPFYEWTVKFEHLGKSTTVSDAYLSSPSKSEHKAGGKIKIKIHPEDLNYFYICE